MTTTIHTEEAIRAMDGPALTRLAYALGLAPDDVQYVDDKKSGWWRGETYQGVFIPLQRWHPHDDLAQAREVFLDKLRQFGLTTHVDWEPFSGGPPGTIEVQMGKWDSQVFSESYSEASDEALAMLRCACLARAAQLRDAMP